MIRTLSAKGWRTNEPGDVKGTVKETIFQSIISLLLGEGGLTPETLMKAFHKYNLYFSQKDIEELLGLTPGTLSIKAKVIPLVSIKKKLQDA